MRAKSFGMMLHRGILATLALGSVWAQVSQPAEPVRAKRLAPEQTVLLEKHFKVALLVGIGEYDTPGLNDLRYPIADIKAVAAELKLQGYTPILMADRQATASQIRQRIKDLADMAEPGKGTVLFYFSGHGFRVGQENYLATYNTTSLGDLAQQGLALGEVQKLLAATGAKQRLAFIDACRNDASAKGANGGRPFDQFEQAEGLRVLYSTAPGKVSYEDDTLQHGVFSYFVARGLHGEAAGSDGLVTFDDLRNWVTARMREYAGESQKIQIPYELGESSGDFLLAKAPPPEAASVTDAPIHPTAGAAEGTQQTSNGSNGSAKPGGAGGNTAIASDASQGSAVEDPPSRIARLSLADGTVSFKPAGVEDWTPAELNRPLSTGDELWIGDLGRAELELSNGLVRLSEQSSFSFLNLTDSATQIKLTQGALSVRLNHLNPGETVEVDTPNTSVTLPAVGDYWFQVNKDGDESMVTVKNGQAEGFAGAANYKVSQSQTVKVSGLSSPTWAFAVAPNTDDRYFAARDRRNEKSASSSFVPDGTIGASELDANGTWKPIRGYGMGWVPDGGAGWQPYRDGHWVWMDPWGWTWVDDAPWGFAPFHYGRWVSAEGQWAWLPGGAGIAASYSPAMVAFTGVSGGAGVGWFPLAPGEVYVPAYSASRRYMNRMNVGNVNITAMNVTTVSPSQALYQHRLRATVVSPEVFAGARSISSRNIQNVPAAQLAQSRVGNVAGIAPQKESLFASRGSRANISQPSAELRTRSVVARAVPPPEKVSFATQQTLLAGREGRPIPLNDLQRIQPAGRTDVRTTAVVRGTQPPIKEPVATAPSVRLSPKDQARQLKQQQEQAKKDAKAQQERQGRERKAADEKRKKDEATARVARQDRQKHDAENSRAAAEQQKRRQAERNTQAQKTAVDKQRAQQAASRRNASTNSTASQTRTSQPVQRPTQTQTQAQQRQAQQRQAQQQTPQQRQVQQQQQVQRARTTTPTPQPQRTATPPRTTTVQAKPAPKPAAKPVPTKTTTTTTQFK